MIYYSKRVFHRTFKMVFNRPDKTEYYLLIAPSIIGLLSYSNLASSITSGYTLGYKDFSFSEFSNYLFRGVNFARHFCLLFVFGPRLT